MFNVELTDEDRIVSENSSIGIQEKSYKDGYWYKIDHFGGEAYAEYLSSALLGCSTLDTSEYVSYDYGIINGNIGSRSKNFLKTYETLITFKSAHESIFGTPFGKPLLGKSLPDKIEYCISFFNKYFQLDVTDYLAKVFYLDMMIRNEDRNFGNLAIIYDENSNEYKTAPIFDDGYSLLVGNEPYKHCGDIKDRLLSVPGKPFVSNLEIQAKYFSTPFTINYEKLYSMLNQVPESLQKEAFIFQIEKYKNELQIENDTEYQFDEK